MTTGGFQYVKDESGPRRVAGTAQRPIIDTLGRVIEDAGLAAGDRVNIEVANHYIRIQKVEA